MQTTIDQQKLKTTRFVYNLQQAANINLGWLRCKDFRYGIVKPTTFHLILQKISAIEFRTAVTLRTSKTQSETFPESVSSIITGMYTVPQSCKYM